MIIEHYRREAVNSIHSRLLHYRLDVVLALNLFLSFQPFTKNNEQKFDNAFLPLREFVHAVMILSGINVLHVHS